MLFLLSITDSIMSPLGRCQAVMMSPEWHERYNNVQVSVSPEVRNAAS